MAKLSSDKKYVTVERGDTLYSIAKTYGNGKSYKQLASINDISNPDLIYIGQEIYLTGVASSTATNDKSTNSNKPTIKHFGLQANTEDNILFATWSWSKSNTDNYTVYWDYYTGTYWKAADHGTTEHKDSTYSGWPDYATQVRFKVKPNSKTYTENDKEKSYWTADWAGYKYFYIKNVPPDKPNAPDISIKDYTVTTTVNGLDSDIDKVEFKFYRTDTGKQIGIGSATPKLATASHSRSLSAGYKYKVNCRIRNTAKVWSSWSDYSSEVAAPPYAPDNIYAGVISDKSVYIEWSLIASAAKYTIEYTTEQRYFNGSDGVSSVTVEDHHYEFTGLTTGDEYFFRVKAIGEDNGESAWSKIISIVLGATPDAPTTWSSTTTATVGEPVTLYWVHNAKDSSSETFANLKYSYYTPIESDGILSGLDFEFDKVIENTADEDEKDGIKSYKLDTSEFNEGTEILWQVATAGVTKVLGDYSIQRSIKVYSPPSLYMNLTDNEGNDIDTITTFPFYVKGLAVPPTQAPIGYTLSIVANEGYETVDDVGNVKMVTAGSEIYSKYFDISEELLVEFTPGNIDLMNNINYTINGSVVMNSGLTAEASLDFTAALEEVSLIPNAEISYDKEKVVTHIHPYCENINTVFYKVELVFGETEAYYVKTDEIVDITTITDSGPVEMVGNPEHVYYTATGEQVFWAGESVTQLDFYYCTVAIPYLVEDVSLSVYRREFDGTFTELATDIDNLANTFITDPHPALDYARYRIVAVSNTTGSMGYYDMPPFLINEKSIIIQWDEEWSAFDSTEEGAITDPPWEGSMLKLPYNVDVSDSINQDVTHVEYAGRNHPVSYYGTQLGETSSWSVEIDKSDRDTLYALRRLRIWMGDVYVREPSGSGYWASIKVTFSQKHLEVTIPVTLEITRVEGGA